ncbi:MAG: hypothetical protein IPN20_00615 [Haliscomenobacter sp.]|nr:hypothetical protein [Haliscomenobacter sp.]
MPKATKKQFLFSILLKKKIKFHAGGKDWSFETALKKDLKIGRSPEILPYFQRAKADT